MLFLGTGAAECCPNPFCSCDFCERARTTGDHREKRRRSALLLDGEDIVDFGPDVMAAAGAYGESLAGLRRIFLTHSHEDHFDYFNLTFLAMSRTPPPKPVLYMSRLAAQGLNELMDTLRGSRHPQIAEQVTDCDSLFSVRVLEPYRRVQLEEGFAVTPVQGNHQGFVAGEQSLNYLFERGEKTLLYAADTGRFFEETYRALRDIRLDTLVIEGSFGLQRLPEGAGHLDLYSLGDTLEALLAQGTVGPGTQVLVTHIAHHAQMSHDEYEQRLQQRFGSQVRLAWDGLRI